MAAPSSPARAATTFAATVRKVSQVCGIIAALMILASVIITCQLIFMRFVLNESTIWQTEAVTYLMIAATMLGLPYVQLLRGHVNVDLVPLLLPPLARRALAVVVALATLAIAAVMVFYGYELWHFAWDRGWRSETVWGVKLWIPYLAVPVGFALYALQLIADIVAPGVADAPAEQERLDAAEHIEATLQDAQDAR